METSMDGGGSWSLYVRSRSFSVLLRHHRSHHIMCPQFSWPKKRMRSFSKCHRRCAPPVYPVSRQVVNRFISILLCRWSTKYTNNPILSHSFTTIAVLTHSLFGMHGLFESIFLFMCNTSSCWFWLFLLVLPRYNSSHVKHHGILLQHHVRTGFVMQPVVQVFLLIVWFHMHRLETNLCFL